MRKLLPVLVLIVCLNAVGQPSPGSDSLNQQDTQSTILIPDLYRQDSIMTHNTISRNMKSMVEIQSNYQKKQKNAAMLRIGFGIAMLVILVIGLNRRKKN